MVKQKAFEVVKSDRRSEICLLLDGMEMGSWRGVVLVFKSFCAGQCWFLVFLVCFELGVLVFILVLRKKSQFF